jgi:hypothetical protein
VNQANEVVKATNIEMRLASKLFGYFESTAHIEIKPANELDAIIMKRYKVFLGKSKYAKFHKIQTPATIPKAFAR